MRIGLLQGQSERLGWRVGSLGVLVGALRLPTLLLPTLLLPLAGCNKESAEKPPESESKDSKENAAPSAPVADREIANALAEASKQSAAANSGAAPPADGILTLERANAEVPVGGALKVTLGSAGAEPRFKLALSPATESRKGQLQVAVRTGPTAALPTVLLTLKTETAKPAAPAAGTATQLATRLDVIVSELAKEQPGQIPEQLRKQIEAIKGSRFDFSTQDGTLLGGTRYQRSAAAPEDSDLLLAMANGALDASLLSFPAEPVGKDAFWMLAARGTFLGTDVVSYRMVKVVEISEQGVSVDVSTKRYAVGTKLGVPGLENAQIMRFQSSDKAQLSFVPGDLYPLTGMVQQSLVAFMNTERGQAPFQIEGQSRLGFAPRK